MSFLRPGAVSRQDGTEVEKLRNTSPCYSYTSVRYDPASTDRIRANRLITFRDCLMSMEVLGKLTVIMTSQECVAFLVKSFVSEIDEAT